MSTLYEEPVRITYYDLDGHSRLKLSALLKLAHIAADINANALGVGYTDLTEHNMGFVLQRFGLEAIRLPRYDETVTLRTWPAAVAKGTFTRCGDILDADGQKLMEWTSLWVLLDLNARKILRPSALPMPLEGIGARGVSVEAERVVVAGPDSMGVEHLSYAHTVRYSEVDTNQHMNNTFYGDLISNAIYTPRNDNTGEWSRVQINFLSEARLGETIDVRSQHDGSMFWVTGEMQGRTVFTASVAHRA